MDLCSEDDPVRVAAIVDGVVASAVAAERMDLSFYSPAQLAARWGITRKSVDRLGLPRHKFGKVVRIAREDVLAFESRARKEN